MKLIKNDGHNLIISHIADIDGMGAAILAKVMDSNINIALVEVSELTGYLNQLNSSKDYEKYEHIFITDLPLRPEAIAMLGSNPSFNQKITHYDHHTSEIKDNLPAYLNVVPEKNGIKTSGTTLLYDYFLEHNPNDKILKGTYIKDFVESVRRRDNWECKKFNDPKGDQLSDIFTIIGDERFIEKYYLEIVMNKKKEVKFDKTESLLLELRQEEITNYIDQCDQRIIRTSIMGYQVGAVFAESFRSELGNALSRKYKDELDFIMIINFARSSFSLRTVTNVDLGALAKAIPGAKGGGQPQAAGFDLNENTRYLIDEILDAKYSKKLTI